MNNKNCGTPLGGGCRQEPCTGGFVPVNGNWNFNMDDGDCGQRRRQNRGNSCPAHAENRNAKPCARQADTCQEQRCVQPAARCEADACTGTTDCPCDACMRRRQADKARQAACACQGAVVRQMDCEPSAKAKKKADNRGVGIVWAKVQELDTIYDCEHALKAGTLYPELHMPMNGYWPCEEGCADGKQEAAFMLWELRLYLNTHSCDAEALALFRQLRAKAEGTYAEVFLPDDCARWAWTDDPWPWEYDCACNR